MGLLKRRSMMTESISYDLRESVAREEIVAITRDNEKIGEKFVAFHLILILRNSTLKLSYKTEVQRNKMYYRVGDLLEGETFIDLGGVN
jgi:hypothetical protein